ncbi:MAG: hypothetical protein ACUVSV_10140 [Armatimonadota bacterium]
MCRFSSTLSSGLKGGCHAKRSLRGIMRHPARGYGRGWAKEYDLPLIVQTYRLLPNGDAEVEDYALFDSSARSAGRTSNEARKGSMGITG